MKNFTSIFVAPVAMLSTAHITKEDGARLLHGPVPAAVIYRSSEGALISIYEFADPDEEFANFSEAFRDIIKKLSEDGYSYVRFDEVFPTIPELPTFDW
jgi:hypothetical protein